MPYVLYTYGTLRPGTGEKIVAKGSLYDLGWFPGVKLGGDYEFVCERVEVEDISSVDRYEGYSEADPEGSLYIRKPFLDGFIYEFNRTVNPAKQIMSGDWLDYTQEKRGRNGGSFR